MREKDPKVALFCNETLMRKRKNAGFNRGCVMYLK